MFINPNSTNNYDSNDGDCEMTNEQFKSDSHSESSSSSEQRLCTDVLDGSDLENSEGYSPR